MDFKYKIPVLVAMYSKNVFGIILSKNLCIRHIGTDQKLKILLK